MATNVHELQVFQRACLAADELFAVIRATPLGRDRDLSAQLNRGSIRVVSDIAEGFEQKTDRHFARYLYDARGGAAEIRAQLGIAQRHGYITMADCERVSGGYVDVGRMLSGLIAYLEREGREHRWKKEKGEPE
ncbi:MAG: four helix bundle protein [Vicinamibacterales bacterium]